MKSLTFIQWYRMLRAHRRWTVFQSIRYALWLMKSEVRVGRHVH
jgi:hypothetical protein